MKRWRRAIAIGLVCFAAVGVVWWKAGSREPEYNGRSLSLWLNDWSAANHSPTSDAATAITTIGTNGLPYLLDWVSHNESPLARITFHSVLDYLHGGLSIAEQSSPRPLNAGSAIHILGPQAQSAFPTLTNLFMQNKNAWPAAIALAGIGEDGVSFLIEAVTNEDWLMRSHATGALAKATTNFEKIVPALIEGVNRQGRKHEDQQTRNGAALSLAYLHKQPELVTPVFCRFLTNPSVDVRSLGVYLLGTLGSDAKAAIPFLKAAETDSDRGVRDGAREAIKKIEATGQNVKSGGKPSP